MTNKLVFATNNAHKLSEVKALLEPDFQIVSLKDIECTDEIPETANTLEGNALIKAKYVYDRFGLDCFADDTGLEIAALNGAPGVYSARYAGEGHDANANMKKVLTNLGNTTHRNAQFRTVITLIRKGQIYNFEGQIKGNIAFEPSGENGFGYDPIFIPENHTLSFAELDATQKNEISHRALAVKKLVKYLKSEI